MEKVRLQFSQTILNERFNLMDYFSCYKKKNKSTGFYSCISHFKKRTEKVEEILFYLF